MNTIIALIGVIALTSIVRLYLVLRSTTHNTHFKAKREGTKKMRWDLQFKVFKTREIREDIRKEYDFMNARMEALKLKLETAKGEEKGKIKDDVVLVERDMKRLKGQMENLDTEVYGAKPTNERPEGHIGLTEQIESLEELESMLGDYIKDK